MIEISDRMASILAGSAFTRYVRIETWQDGELLAADLPVTDAGESQDAGLRVPERLTFSVPAIVDNVSLVPDAYDSPLTPYGQRARVSLGVATNPGEVEWITRGWFVLWSTKSSDDTIDVEALGLLALVDEATLIAEYQPRAGATLATIVRALVEPGITVNTENAPADRTAPNPITYSDNRLDAVLSTLDAWPADATVTAEGFLAITAPAPDPTLADVVMDLSDLTGGTLTGFGTTLTREGAFNAVVGKGAYPDTDATRAGQEIIVTVRDTDLSSPFRAGGPFSPYLVPYGFASPLMITANMVRSAAMTTLRKMRATASRSVTVTAVPHPGIELGDVVTVTSTRHQLAAALGTVTGFQLPYFAAAGPMTVTVRLED